MIILIIFLIFQQVYFVNDFDEVIQSWSRVFGVGLFVWIWYYCCDTFMYWGTKQEVDVLYAFGYLGDMMIQFIVQHDETLLIYRDMYVVGQEGYYYMVVFVNDFEVEYQWLMDLGFELVCWLYVDGVDVVYFDMFRLACRNLARSCFWVNAVSFFGSVLSTWLILVMGWRMSRIWQWFRCMVVVKLGWLFDWLFDWLFF